MSQPEDKRQFTKAELFEHCNSNPDKVFLSVHDNIYDVTPFLDEVNKFLHKSPIFLTNKTVI